jgi:drug/metabolite transporter superfamily protein YnfA
MKSRLKDWIDSIADDKKDHILLGMTIGYPLMTLGYIIDIIYGTEYFIVLGAALGILFALGKEVIWDWIMDRGTPEVWDFIATAVPIIFPLLCYLSKYFY